MKYIIDFTDTATTAEIEQYFLDHACTQLGAYVNYVNCFVVECEVAPPVTDLVEKLVVDDPQPLKLLAEPMPTKSFSISDDDNWWKLASLGSIDLEQDTATILRAGQGVGVYVMDSGITADHSEFVNKDITLLHSVIENDFTDTTGHGTALASLIVGETCGITEAALKVVKVFHEGRDTALSELIAAFDAVATDYLAQGQFLAVLNLSWSIPKNTYIEEKIQRLIDIGIFVVASAGNSGDAIVDVTPACMADVITVGSFGQDLTPSDFSNYTAADSDTSFTAEPLNYGALDTFAPGENIRVALRTGGFGHAQGTSLSAAIQSAVLALNIASSGLTLETLGDASVHELVIVRSLKDVLTLSGNYASSANFIPFATIIPSSDNQVRGMRVFPVKAGESKTVWLFDGIVFRDAALSGLPEWVSLDQSQLRFTAPMLTEIETFSGVLEVTNPQGEVETHNVYIIVVPEDGTDADLQDEMVKMEFADQFACNNYCRDVEQMNYCCQCCSDKGQSTCLQCSQLQCNPVAC